jgi:hypothetical protein
MPSDSPASPSNSSRASSIRLQDQPQTTIANSKPLEHRDDRDHDRSAPGTWPFHAEFAKDQQWIGTKQTHLS